MKTKLLKKQQGFTIIEVMIVLAIAAIIMVIVFLAVPNLQRNSRNTQRKTDANNLLSLINEFKGNNNGGLPAHTCLSGTTFQVGNGASCAALTGVVSGSASAQASSVSDIAAKPAVLPATPANGTLVVYSNASCTNNQPSAGTSNTQVAVWFSVEPGTIDQCVSG